GFVNQASGSFWKDGILGNGTTTIMTQFSTAGQVNLYGKTVDFTGGVVQTGGTTNANAGTLIANGFTLAGGTLDVGQGTVRSGLTIADGATLAGTGMIVGNVFNNGAVDIGATGGLLGRLTIDWSYTQSSTATLNIRLRNSANLDYDSLAVSGTASLD